MHWLETLDLQEQGEALAGVQAQERYCMERVYYFKMIGLLIEYFAKTRRNTTAVIMLGMIDSHCVHKTCQRRS